MQLLLELLPLLPEYVPMMHRWHSNAPSWLDQLPGEHVWQVPMLMAPRACENDPAGHLRHVSGLLCPRPPEYVPYPHRVHMSAVVMPCTVEYVPCHSKQNKSLGTN